MRQWTSQSFLFRGLSFLSQDPPKITKKKSGPHMNICFFGLSYDFFSYVYIIYLGWSITSGPDGATDQWVEGGRHNWVTVVFFVRVIFPGGWTTNKRSETLLFLETWKKPTPKKIDIHVDTPANKWQLTWKPQDNCWFRLIDAFFDLLGGITYIHVHPQKIHRLSMDQKSGSSATGMY